LVRDKVTFFLSYWTPLLLWCGFIFVCSHHEVPGALTQKETFRGSDIIGHFLFYFPLGFLFFRARPSLFWAALFSLLYGFSDEIHQWFLSFRSFEWKDIFVDAVSGGIGAVCLYRWKGVGRNG